MITYIAVMIVGLLAAFAAGCVVGYARRDRMYVEPWRNQSYMVPVPGPHMEVR